MGMFKTKYNVGEVVMVSNYYDEIAAGRITEIKITEKSIVYNVRLGFDADILVKEDADVSCNCNAYRIYRSLGQVCDETKDDDDDDILA